MAEFLLRWFHYLGGITWIGLLYYFNFVQGPFMAEADPGAKSTATQKLLPRALSWFRGGAIVTFLTGILIIAKRFGESPLGAAAWSTPWAITILTGALFGTLMFFNVVLVIWPKQQIVIASAKAAASGGQANAAAPVAARRAFLASRTNVVFSIPMLFYMGAASHFTLPGGGNHAAYWASVLVVAALLEINSLTATTGATVKPIEKIPGVIVTGFVVWAVVYGLSRGRSYRPDGITDGVGYAPPAEQGLRRRRPGVAASRSRRAGRGAARTPRLVRIREDDGAPLHRGVGRAHDR